MKKKPMLSLPDNIKNIEVGTFDKDFHKIANYDWVCEAVVEKLEIKREIFTKIEKFRSKSSFVSSNTSGIPLKEITKAKPTSHHVQHLIEIAEEALSVDELRNDSLIAKFAIRPLMCVLYDKTSRILESPLPSKS